MAIGLMMFVNTLRTGSALLCPLQLAFENLSGITNICPDAYQAFDFWFFGCCVHLVVPIFSLQMAFKSRNIEINEGGYPNSDFKLDENNCDDSE